MRVLQSHWTLSIMGALSAVARPMCTRSVFRGGAAQLLPLMELMLPGIDMNDPTKTFSAFQFIINVAMTVTFGDCAAAGGSAPDDEVEREAYYSTGAPMEAWLEGYLSKLFALVRARPGPGPAPAPAIALCVRALHRRS